MMEWQVVLAPQGIQGSMKKCDPETMNYTYIRTGAKNEMIDNIPFKSYSGYWRVDDLITGTDAVYLYGPSAEGKDQYFNIVSAQPPKKLKAVQLLKIKDHKIDYFSENNLDDFEAKLQKPPSQKKAPAYNGKKFEINNYHVANNNDFFVVGQNFNPTKDGTDYLDILGFHFDGKGKLKAQYSVDCKENNKFSKANGTPQFFIEKPGKNEIFWFLREIKGVPLFSVTGKLLTYPRVAKIDVDKGAISDFTVYGAEDKFYLDPKFPYLETYKGNTVVFFGSDKPEKPFGSYV